MLGKGGVVVGAIGTSTYTYLPAAAIACVYTSGAWGYGSRGGCVIYLATGMLEICVCTYA